MSMGTTMSAGALTSHRLLLALLAVSLAIPFGSCRGSLLSDCTRSAEAPISSPDRHWEAQIITVDCGATTATAKWVVLKERGGWWPWPPRWLVATIEAVESPAVLWDDDHELRVRLPEKSEVFRLVKHCRGLVTEFEAPPSLTIPPGVLLDECDQAE